MQRILANTASSFAFRTSIKPIAFAVHTIFSAALAISGMSIAVAQGVQASQYTIPAGPLGEALNRFAQQANVAVVVDTAAVRGLQSQGLRGKYSVEEGFNLLLAGSGYVIGKTPAGYVLISSSGEGIAKDAAVLPVVSVQGTSNDDLPLAYAGGQVARGARLGVLGNTDIMDAPFNVTSYTAKTIEDQQARSIADVISRTDPSVRLDYGDGTSVDGLIIRGFTVANDELALNGLPGILGQYRVSTEFVERVEVLKGPSALLNGASPRNAVGGAVNVVSKRAPDEALTRVGASYLSSSVIGVSADIARRFGADKEFGIRVNAAGRDGDTARDNLTDHSGMASVGFDYRGTNLRASLDVLTQRQTMFGARGTVSLAKLTGPAIAAPDGSNNFAQPWNVQRSTDDTVMANVEYDINSDLTVFAAIGHSKDKTTGPVYNPPSVDSAGNFNWFSVPIDWRQETTSSQLGLRGKFDTGTIKHQWSASASQVKRSGTSLFDFAGLSSGSSNIYQPVASAEPAAGTPFVDPYTAVSSVSLPSIALTDTMSFVDDKVLVTLGMRRQTVESDNYIGYASTGLTPENFKKTVNSPMAAVVVKPWDSVSLYTNYIQGLSVGATAPIGANNAGTVFPPFKTKQIEVGAKIDWGRLGSTVSIFQISKPSGSTDAAGFYGVNEKQRNRGVEVNVFGEVTRGVRVLGGISLVDSEFTESSDAALLGNRPVGVARQLLNLGAEWDLQAMPGVTLTARAVHTGDTYADTANVVKVPSWTTYDIGGRYLTSISGKAVIFRAVLENAFNKNYWRQGDYANLGMPRTLAVSATVDF